jgi:hypothetical protein
MSQCDIFHFFQLEKSNTSKHVLTSYYDVLNIKFALEKKNIFFDFFEFV